MEINKLGIRTKEEQLYVDILVALEQAVVDIAKSMLDFMRAYNGDKSIDSYFDYEFDDSHDMANGHLEVLVGNRHWKSFIANYGKGSKMATESDNPFLAEYKQQFFHRFRYKDNAITAREKGNYTTPNWEDGDGYITKYTKGRIPAGTNLEESYAWTTYRVKIRPKNPKFFMERTFDFFEGEMNRKIQEVLDKFPYENYFEGVQK